MQPLNFINLPLCKQQAKHHQILITSVKPITSNSLLQYSSLLPNIVDYPTDKSSSLTTLDASNQSSVKARALANNLNSQATFSNISTLKEPSTSILNITKIKTDNNCRASTNQSAENIQGTFMQTYTNSVHPLIESLAQSSPAATSTPNPIQQQQQQSLLNQDLITNLFLKFDPTSFLPHTTTASTKDQLSLIASTLANTNNNTNQDHQTIMHANNLASFNSLLNSTSSSNPAEKQSNSDGNTGSSQTHNKASKKILLNANMSSQLQHQQFIKIAGQQNQQQNYQQILQQQQQQNQHSQQQHHPFQLQQVQSQHQSQQQQQQQYQLINNLQQQQFHQQQLHQIQLQQQQQQIQLQLQTNQQAQATKPNQAPNIGNNSNNITKNSIDPLNDSTSSDGGEHNSSGGATTGERPYKCAQCFKTFRKKVHLNQHGRIHSGERPYGCDYCEKRFTQLSHLWQHRRRHTGERPYKCDIGTCDKSFTQLSNLQSHLKTHGGQVSASSSSGVSAAIAAVAALSSTQINSSNYSQVGTIGSNQGHGSATAAGGNNKCSRCAKSFFSKEELVAHVSNKRGRCYHDLNASNKRHFCELCQKRFATEGVITKHRYSHAQNEALLVRNADGTLVIKAINNPTGLGK